MQIVPAPGFRLRNTLFVPISKSVVTHAYTLVFTRELPDSKVVRQVKRTLRDLFETDEVTTSDSRKFSFVTSIREEKVQGAVDLFGRDQRRKFVMEGGEIHEIKYQPPNVVPPSVKWKE